MPSLFSLPTDLQLHILCSLESLESVFQLVTASPAFYSAFRGHPLAISNSLPSEESVLLVPSLVLLKAQSLRKRAQDPSLDSLISTYRHHLRHPRDFSVPLGPLFPALVALPCLVEAHTYISALSLKFAHSQLSSRPFSRSRISSGSTLPSKHEISRLKAAAYQLFIYLTLAPANNGYAWSLISAPPTIFEAETVSLIHSFLRERLRDHTIVFETSPLYFEPENSVWSGERARRRKGGYAQTNMFLLGFRNYLLLNLPLNELCELTLGHPEKERTDVLLHRQLLQAGEAGREPVDLIVNERLVNSSQTRQGIRYLFKEGDGDTVCEMKAPKWNIVRSDVRYWCWTGDSWYKAAVDDPVEEGMHERGWWDWRRRERAGLRVPVT